MGLLNGIFGALVNLMVSPCKGFPWLGLVLVSVATGALMLLIYKHTSNQAGIKKSKDQIKARLLEMLLFRDDIVVSFRSQIGILKANLMYMGYAIVPLIVILPVIALLLSQLEAWYGMRPLKIGESTLLKVSLKQAGPGLPDAALEVSDGLTVDTPAFRAPNGREIYWRIRAAQEGTHETRVLINGAEAVKSIAVMGGFQRLSERRGSSILDQILYPVERPLDKNSAIARMDISYPDSKVKLGSWEQHWLIYFFAFSILFAFALRGPLGVEI